MCDAVVPQQGPNYILAKRLQHWRAVLSREQGRHAQTHTQTHASTHTQSGSMVSSNIAPSTATASVVSNFSFKLAYGYRCMSHFIVTERYILRYICVHF